MTGLFLFFFLVPKPRLGNALAGEVPRLPVTGDGPKPGLRAQTRSQAGAWERGYKFFGCGQKKEISRKHIKENTRHEEVRL